jgi:hypothetical protein
MGCNPSRHVGLDYGQCSVSGVGGVSIIVVGHSWSETKVGYTLFTGHEGP